MADVNSIVFFGVLFLGVEFAALAFLAKKTSDEVESKLSQAKTRAEKLGFMVDKLDEERVKTREESEKKVGRLALEKIMSEAIDFVSSMKRKNAQ